MFNYAMASLDDACLTTLLRVIVQAFDFALRSSYMFFCGCAWQCSAIRLIYTCSWLHLTVFSGTSHVCLCVYLTVLCGTSHVCLCVYLTVLCGTSHVCLCVCLTVHCGTSYLSIYNGFASPTAEPARKLCGQQYFYESGLKEFKSNTFR